MIPFLPDLKLHLWRQRLFVFINFSSQRYQWLASNKSSQGFRSTFVEVNRDVRILFVGYWGIGILGYWDTWNIGMVPKLGCGFPVPVPIMASEFKVLICHDIVWFISIGWILGYLSIRIWESFRWNGAEGRLRFPRVPVPSCGRHCHPCGRILIARRAHLVLGWN